MSQDRPPPSDRKLGLVAPVSIAVVVAVILLGAAIFTRPGTSPPPTPTPAPAPAPIATVVAKAPADPVLSRTEIVKEADAMAAAFVEDGNLPPAGRDPMAGRRFRVRIPFGCDGPQVGGGGAQAFYEFDAKARTLRLVARPGVWTTLPMIQSIGVDKVESAEGFWIPQPWRFADGCPPRRETPLPATATPSAPQTLGLAQIYPPGASRVSRRGERPYEQVIKLEDDAPLPLENGFRLVLEGRLAAFPSGRVARCWSESADHRPVCLYAVQFERVAFEAGADGKLLAEWRD